MARMLGRFRHGRCDPGSWYCRRYCRLPGDETRRRKRLERREVLVEIEDEMPPPAFFDERDLAAIARYEDDPSISD